MSSMPRVLRNTVGLLADLVIGAFGLVLAARGLLLASALPLVAAGVDLMSRLGLLPFARRSALSIRQRGDLVWGSVLLLIGCVLVIEELVVLVEGNRGARHLVVFAIGTLAFGTGLFFFGRLVRSRR